MCRILCVLFLKCAHNRPIMMFVWIKETHNYVPRAPHNDGGGVNWGSKMNDIVYS